ncbi:TPA: hypothetical protein N0F65_007894 [Lagenidium giganteum]|uniref:Uncharacterized protein n=1 Tax=Lagenidium giganteum TaxID=4803 RepID=A0AAV2Z3P2_9STRA|nr:TPA: hypothetical protein N0F65_007894 [Lagenidium giganteum]
MSGAVANDTAPTTPSTDAESSDYEQLLDVDAEHGTSSSTTGFRFSWRTFWAYTGPGWLMSMAYLDPGNLEADLQSGAYTRYDLLYVVLLSTLAGGIYQILAARLGACTGRHLAQWCRAEYPPVVSKALWVMAEVAIVGSDIQEVLGSAIAFNLLFGLPLWVGCCLTGLDTFTFLALHRADKSNSDRGSRYLEMFFMFLIGTMCVCFFLDFSMSDPDGLEIAKGIFIPRLQGQQVMQAVGTIGSIIMPHNVFLHSALVQARGINPYNKRAVREANFYFSIEAFAALFVSFLINGAVICAFASTFYSTQCDELSTKSMSAIMGHGIQTSCIPMNTALASGSPIYDAYTGAVCHFPGECTPCYIDKHRVDPSANGMDFVLVSMPNAGYCQQIGLAAAGDAVKEALGNYAKVMWALGLLASGQASTMTGTYAGQFVMEGFLDIRIDAWKRVALTRGVALVPAVIVAVISQNDHFNGDRFNEFLNVLQSVQLPFSLIPLLSFTSNKVIMGRGFVTGRWTARLLVMGTALLCSVNYSLVYRILNNFFQDHDFSLPMWGATLLFALFYSTLLLYLVLSYPSRADEDWITGLESMSKSKQQSKHVADDKQALLRD